MDFQGFHEIEFHKQTSSIKLSREKYILLHLKPYKQILFNINPNLKGSNVWFLKAANPQTSLVPFHQPINRDDRKTDQNLQQVSAKNATKQVPALRRSVLLHIRKIPSPNKQLPMILLGKKPL